MSPIRPTTTSPSLFWERIQQLCPHAGEEALTYLAQGFKERSLERKHFYLHAGERQRYIACVETGLIRAFYINSAGDEINVEFIPEGHFATYYTRLEHPSSSRYYFQTIEPTRLTLLPYQHLAEAIVRYPLLERLVRMTLEEEHHRLLIRLEGQLFEDAEQRYRRFLLEYPSLMSRISVSDLCTYLGITRQTLTRIRRKLLQAR